MTPPGSRCVGTAKTLGTWKTLHLRVGNPSVTYGMDVFCLCKMAVRWSSEWTFAPCSYVLVWRSESACGDVVLDHENGRHLRYERDGES